MEIYSTEEQQVDAIKQFAKEYGPSILIGAVVGLGGLYGWNTYSDIPLETYCQTFYDSLKENFDILPERVQRLMHYEDYSAGGMMTTEPIVLTADSTVAEALSRVRLSEVAPGLASQVFVCRQPLETPTGRLMGVVYIQRLLREPPATLLGSILDSDIAPLSAETTLSEVSSYLASYNLLAVPIVDANERLLGAVTVDDVLDHLLPENWRQDETKRKESESR